MAKKTVAPKTTGAKGTVREGDSAAAFYALRSEQATKELVLREQEHEWRKQEHEWRKLEQEQRVERHRVYMKEASARTTEAYARTALYQNLGNITKAVAYVLDPSRKDNNVVTDMSKALGLFAKRFLGMQESELHAWRTRERKNFPNQNHPRHPHAGAKQGGQSQPPALTQPQTQPVVPEQPQERRHPKHPRRDEPLKHGMEEKLKAAIAAQEGEQTPKPAEAAAS